MHNKFMVITGPSGSGKTTTLSKLIEYKSEYFDIHKSYTTRSPRDINDYNYYHFSTMDEFFDKIRNNELVEWEEIYSDSYYGTPKSGLLKGEKLKVLVKDVKGAKFLKRLYEDKCILVYLKTDPVYLEEYKKRISNDSNRDKVEERYKRIEYENSFTYTDLKYDLSIDTVKEPIDNVLNTICTYYYHLE